MATEGTIRLTVSELTELVKNTLEASFYGLTVEGEVSGFKLAQAGHWYFSLKDNNSLIKATMWRSSAMRAPFIPRDGQKVIVTGSLSVYPPSGTYQINCTSIRQAGEGDILAMLEERKRRYAAMGWFDEELKKPLPVRPERVAVITSGTGAALQDILQVTGRRNAGLDIIILPALVQGPGAAAEIAARIEEVNRFCLAPVMIVGRGGGSVEDLLAFSDDLVIQAIHESEVPVISAVGHEVDWAISDFAADLRAPTPSAAAELVCQAGSQQMEKVTMLRLSMLEAVRSRISPSRLRLEAAGAAASKRIIENRIGNMRLTLDSYCRDMTACIRSASAERRHGLEVQRNLLRVINPKAVLDRGYAIVSTEDGKTLRRAGDAGLGNKIRIRLSEGRIGASVTEVDNDV